MPSIGNERKGRRAGGDVDIVGGDTTATGRAKRPGKVGVRKEDWIGEQLRHVYDEALDEAIPDEMLALLRQLDDKAGGEGGDRS
jgi:hypothetical protein